MTKYSPYSIAQVVAELQSLHDLLSGVQGTEILTAVDPIQPAKIIPPAIPETPSISVVTEPPIPIHPVLSQDKAEQILQEILTEFQPRIEAELKQRVQQYLIPLSKDQSET